MRIDFHGRVTDEPVIRAGFIGCGSHSFRNVYPTFQFAPVNLVATCDLHVEKAQAFARQFGAERAYSDHREMVAQEKLDAVFIVTNYDDRGRPRYPGLAIECLEAGCHVWTEKPPAATSAEIAAMQVVARKRRRKVLVGMKKMFAAANEKAEALMRAKEFGRPALALLQYPQYVPTAAEFDRYLRKGEASGGAISFLDHLCHPMSLMVYLFGMPATLHYERSRSGAGVATFTFASGVVATLAMTHGAAHNGGMERTTIVSDSGQHIVVDNNHRVTLHRNPPGIGYGDTPSYFQGTPEQTSAVWDPEFSLGQLYNKGIFLLGYYGEVNEFARAILEKRPLKKGTLEQAWQVTRIFEGFAEGPGQTIDLGKPVAK